MDSTRQKPIAKKNRRRTHQTPVKDLARDAVDALLDKKGINLTVMDMHEVSGVADIFVLATGESELQIKALADAVVERIRDRHHERPWHVEGYEGRQWVLLDYVDLVVHIFSQEKRTFYGLERLWNDAPSESVSPELPVDEIKLLQEEGGPKDNTAPSE